MNSGLPDIEKTETMTSVAGHDSVTGDYFVYVVNKGEKIDKTIKGVKVISFDTEEEMVMKISQQVEEVNPTIVTGWNIDYFDVTYLYNRIKVLFGERTKNELSPINKVSWNKYRNRYIIMSVSCLDYLEIVQELQLDTTSKLPIGYGKQLELGRGKIEYEGNLDQLFRDDLEKFIEYNLVDVELVVDLDKKLQFIELARASAIRVTCSTRISCFHPNGWKVKILTFLRRSDKGRLINQDVNHGTKMVQTVKVKFTIKYVKEPKHGSVQVGI